MIIDSEGNQQKNILTNVFYVPELTVNLFSLTTVMEKNFLVSGMKTGIEILKGTWKVDFNMKFGPARGLVFGTKIIPEVDKKREKMKLDHAGTKSKLLPAKSKNTMFSRGVKWLSNFQAKSKKNDLYQDDHDDESLTDLHCEVRNLEGQIQNDLEEKKKEYIKEDLDEETIEFYTEDVKEDEEKDDEEETIEFYKDDSLENSQDEDPIEISNDYNEGLKKGNDMVKESYFKHEKSTVESKEDPIFC